MIVRRQVIEDIGAMDDHFFLYFEETDFCLRANRLGWAVWYVPDSRVIHLVSQATGVTLVGGQDENARPKRRPAYWFNSRRRYYTKNYGLMYTVLTDLAWILGSCGGTVKRWLKRQPPYDPPKLFTDFIRNSAMVKGKE